MSVRVAIVGYGAVASVHARQLKQLPEAQLVSVFGPHPQQGRLFAEAHGIPEAARDLESLLARAEAVIVASPSPLHYQQARECLQAGRHALVELPPCQNLEEARELDRLSENRLVLRCAHTSRFLTPYRQVGSWLRQGRLGEIQQVNYIRHLEPPDRSWADNAFFHHAAHPVDLLLDWFGDVQPLACLVRPSLARARDVTLMARLPGRIPALISVSYTSRRPAARMLVLGQLHTIETDGFSCLSSDAVDLNWRGTAQQEYEKAIGRQDRSFLRACAGEEEGASEEGASWEETKELVTVLEGFAALQEPGRRNR